MNDLFNLKAQNVDGGIKLTWDKNPDADFYLVYRSENMKLIDEMAYHFKTNGNVTQIIDERVESDKNYSYIVQAVKLGAHPGMLTVANGAAEPFDQLIAVDWNEMNYKFKNLKLDNVYVAGGAFE